MNKKSIQFYNFFLLDFLKLAPLIIIFFILRLILHSTIRMNLGSNLEILTAYLVGLRFDLLIIGFILIPVVFLRLIDTLLFTKFHLLKTLIQIYYIAIVSYMALITLISGMFFALFHYHVRGKFLGDINYTIIEFFEMSFGKWSFSISAGLIIFTFYYLNLWIWRLKFKSSFQKQWPSLVYYFLPFVIVALLARGTLTPHHLAKEHCKINQLEPLTQLCLNPIWAFFN